MILGIVTTKRAELEDKDVLKRRIEEASQYVDIDQLGLSGQCGFSSTEEGNDLTIDEQKAKLELIVEVAAGGLGLGSGEGVDPGVAGPLASNPAAPHQRAGATARVTLLVAISRTPG